MGQIHDQHSRSPLSYFFDFGSGASGLNQLTSVLTLLVVSDLL
ncbi:hypothetical protein ABH909_002372 [Pseudomonas sp. BS3782 TE3695]|jgi:hypothetical protein